MKIFIPKFIRRKLSYMAIMELNKQINAITGESNQGYNIRKVAELEKKKSVYIEEYKHLF